METFFIVTTIAVFTVVAAFKLGGVFQRRKDRAAVIPLEKTGHDPVTREAKDYYESDKR